MFSEGFETTTSESTRLQAHALDPATSDIFSLRLNLKSIFIYKNNQRNMEFVMQSRY